MTRNTTLLIIIVLVILACLSVIQLSYASPAAPPCKDCNVILIGVDTLRADHVHAFGYPLETTPTIDSVAAEGYAFTNAISPSSWTVPSFMSVMTGVYPAVHKVINKYVIFNSEVQKLSNLKELSPEIMTLAEAMKAAGYATGGFTGDAGVGGGFGYKQGFDIYTDEKTFGGFANSDVHAREWLDKLPEGQKFFMFFHGYDLHGQFDIPKAKQIFVPEGYTGQYTGSAKEEALLREEQLHNPLAFSKADTDFWMGLYDSKVRAADDQLALFMEDLRSRGLLENTVIIIVADHGEEYFEHQGIDHGHALYDELVRVPIIVKVPGLTSGKQISAQVTTMDVAPTILDLVGVSTSSAFDRQQQGKSLIGYITGSQSAGRDIFLETDYRDFTHKRGVRSADGWKYIVTLENEREELYDLKADPQEKKNLVLQNAAKADELRKKLRNHVENTLHLDPDAPVTVGCLPVYKGECE